jgi:hypothetical protein
MKLSSASTGAILASLAMCLGAQVVRSTSAGAGRGQAGFATVTVLAFDTTGRFLGAPDINLFERENEKNLAEKFHEGVAKGMPLGVYRIEAVLPAYYPERRIVRVYQPDVTIVMGLESGFREASPVPLTLHGRVTGKVPAVAKHRFVKVSGVFVDVSVEASIGQGGVFDVSGLSWGLYLLFVVDEDGILAMRTLNIPYTGPPLEIKIGRAHIGAPQ